MEYNRNMSEKTWKLLSEILLSIAIGIVLSIFVLVIYQFQSFKLFSISFFLTLIVISMSLYCLNFLGKYGFSLKRIEFIGIAISLCITLLYVRTISLTTSTEMELLKMMFYLYGLLILATAFHLFVLRKHKP